MVSDQSREFLNIYGHYKNGHLPYEGGIMNQPNAIIDAINLLNGMINNAS